MGKDIKPLVDPTVLQDYLMDGMFEKVQTDYDVRNEEIKIKKIMDYVELEKIRVGEKRLEQKLEKLELKFEKLKLKFEKLNCEREKLNREREKLEAQMIKDLNNMVSKTDKQRIIVKNNEENVC